MLQGRLERRCPFPLQVLGSRKHRRHIVYTSAQKKAFWESRLTVKGHGALKKNILFPFYNPIIKCQIGDVSIPYPKGPRPKV